MIIMVRADDRLIHGMVAVSWTSHLQPQTILVANNVAAKDSFKAMTMKMAKPAGVNLVIKSLDDSVKALNSTSISDASSSLGCTCVRACTFGAYSG